MTQDLASCQKKLTRLRVRLASSATLEANCDEWRRIARLVSRITFCVFACGLRSLQSRMSDEAYFRRLCQAPVLDLLVYQERNMRCLLLPVMIAYYIECWATGICNMLQDLPEQLPMFVATKRLAGPYAVHVEAIVNNAVRRWAAVASRLTIPRPQPLDYLLDMAATIRPVIQFGYLKNDIRGNFCGTDALLRESFGRYSNSISAQIDDYLVSAMSRMLDGLLLHGSKEGFLRRAKAMWEHVSKRIVSRYYCKKAQTLSATPCSLLRAMSPDCMVEFLEYLEDTGLFHVIYADRSVIEFSSNRLVDAAAREKFESACRDDPDQFGDDFIVTCFTDTHAAHTVESDMGRHFKIDHPAGSIVVSARNSLARNKFVREICETRLVRLVDGSVSSEAGWNECERQSRIASIYGCVTQTWIIDVLRREGVLSMDPHFACSLFNCVATMMLDVLTGHMPVDGALELVAWRCLNVLLCEWLRLLVELHWDRRLTMLQRKMPPILRFCHALADLCPCGAAVDRLGLQAQLIAVQQLLELESRRCTAGPEADGCNIDFCLKSIHACLQKLRGRHAIEAAAAEGFIVGDASGYGGGCAVYKVFDHGLKHTVALKEFACRQPADEELLQEANLMQQLEHPNIVKLHRIVQRSQALHLTVEFCSGGTLLDYIRTQPRVDDLTFRRFAVQILQGLTHLHCNNVMHGGLTPRNVMISIFDEVKLADFGATRTLVDTVKGVQHHCSIGTIQYMAPETLLHGTLSLQSDIWSLGCTLFQLATGVKPWSGHEGLLSLMGALQSGAKLPTAALGRCGLDNDAVQMILSCLRKDPHERPTASVLLLSPFLYEPVPYENVRIQPSW